MDALTLSVAESALPEATDHGTRVGELGGGAVPPVGRRRHSRKSRLAAAADNAGDAQVVDVVAGQASNGRTVEYRSQNKGWRGGGWSAPPVGTVNAFYNARTRA